MNGTKKQQDTMISVAYACCAPANCSLFRDGAVFDLQRLTQVFLNVLMTRTLELYGPMSAFSNEEFFDRTDLDTNGYAELATKEHNSKRTLCYDRHRLLVFDDVVLKAVSTASLLKQLSKLFVY